MTNSIVVEEDALTEDKFKETCDILQNDDAKIVSLRRCKVTFSQMKNILKYVEQSKALLQLSLNVGIITNQRRMDLLCRTIKANQSLQALLLHGNNIGDPGMKKLSKILLDHPSIVCLDVSDCDLSDVSVEAICNLLPHHGKKTGLIELSMSSNPKISEQGWIKLSVSMAASSCLKELYLDYNNIGDLAASSVLVSLASHRHLQVLDLEGTNITDKFAELLLYLIENYPTNLQKVNLDENAVNKKLLKSIKLSLLDGETASEMSDKTLEKTSSEESSESSESESSEDLSNSETSQSEDETTEVKAMSVTSLDEEIVKESETQQLASDQLIDIETTWDGDELIEITEPPIVNPTSSLTSLQSYGGVNLGQVVSVSIGKGSVPDEEQSDEELKEVKLVSVC